MEARERRLEDNHLLLFAIGIDQEVTDALLKWRFLALETGRQVVRACIVSEKPMGGEVQPFLDGKRKLLFKKGT
jgi:hypothetical protein